MTLGTEHEPWRTARRRQAGELLRDAPRSSYDVASVLGMDRSNARRMLSALRDAGAVTERADRPDGHAQYELSPEQEAELLRAIDAAQPLGRLLPGQALVTVSVRDGQESVFADALRASAVTAGVVWAGRLQGTGAEYTLVFDRDAGALASLRVSTAMEALGLPTRRALVEEVLGPEELRRYAGAIRRSRRDVLRDRA